MKAAVRLGAPDVDAQRARPVTDDDDPARRKKLGTLRSRQGQLQENLVSFRDVMASVIVSVNVLYANMAFDMGKSGKLLLCLNDGFLLCRKQALGGVF